MSTQLVPCPTGGKCGHKQHDPRKSEYARCQKAASGKGKNARSGGIAPVSDAVTPRPEFPRESLGGAYSICPACQASIHPDENSEKSHWTREHAGVSLTPDQLDEAQVFADRFRVARNEDVARAEQARAERRGGGTEPSPEDSGFEMSEQHPLEYDRVSGWHYQMHCNSCGEYVEDSPARQGVPAVDYLCDDCEGSAEE